MQKLILVLVIILRVSTACSQGCYDCQWRFGYFAGLDFSSGNPVSITNSGLAGDEAFASIADSNGNLLFYCNAMNIFNSQNQLMESGDSLYGYPFINNTLASTTTQGCLILPLPDSHNLFYVFVQRPGAVTDSSLNYSIVDLSFNGGLGKIIQKNIPLLDNELSEKMIAIKHGNGRDWWILLHEFGTDQFIKFLLTPFSIQGPFYQNIGSIYNNCFAGQLASNRDGNKIVSAVFNDGKIDLFDFDRCYGLLSNFIQIGDNFQLNGYEDSQYGCVISPNGNNLYIARWAMDILQYDIRVGHILDQPTTIWDNFNVFSDSDYCQIGQMQIANDNKIYISFRISPQVIEDTIYDHYLHVINQPDSLGLACDFQIEGVYLGGKTTLASLPNMPNYNLGRLIGSECDTVYNAVHEPNKKTDLNWSIFPNPAKENLIIESNKLPINSIEIDDVLGRKIYEENFNRKTTSINLVSFPAGVYIIKVQLQNESVQVKKFVKE